MEGLQSSACKFRPSYFVEVFYFHIHGAWWEGGFGKVIEGNLGSWSHQIKELRSSRINQNEIKAAGHLRGARCGIKV